MTFTFNISKISEAIDKAFELLAPLDNDEFNKRIQAMINGDEETYRTMLEYYYANLNHGQCNKYAYTFDLKKYREDIKAKAVEEQIKITAFLNRRHRHASRISQGDFKSTSFIACMPVPPTMMMEGGLYHTAKVGV